MKKSFLSALIFLSTSILFSGCSEKLDEQKFEKVKELDCFFDRSPKVALIDYNENGKTDKELNEVFIWGSNVKIYNAVFETKEHGTIEGIEVRVRAGEKTLKLHIHDYSGLKTLVTDHSFIVLKCDGNIRPDVEDAVLYFHIKENILSIIKPSFFQTEKDNF